MPIRQELPPILRGEAAADLSPEARVRLETLAEQARATGEDTFVRDECAARVRQQGASLGVEYLLGFICAMRGERERALQTWLALADRLAQARAWEPLAAITERALALEETAAGARLLVRAHEGLARDPERIDALWRAWQIIPDDLELGLLLAVRLGETGRAEDRRALLAELLPRFVAEGRHAGLEEATLEFVEHEDVDGLLRVVGVLPDVAAGGALQEARQILDLALPPLSRGGRAGEIEASVRSLIRHAAERDAALAESLRGPLLQAVRQGSARAVPDPAAVLAISGLGDSLKPLLPALEQFDRVAALPPGRAVLHGSFGAGRIVGNDGDVVVIDFARSKGHRMPYAAARGSLTPLAEDDLRLLKFTDPAGLERLRKEQPAEVLVRALHAMGGEADGQKLKLFLVGHGIVPANEWTVTYRKLKSAGEADPRIDHARAYEQIYRLAPAGTQAAAAPLPALGPRKPVRTNLATIRKFLSQHPDAEAALAQRFGRYIEKALLDESGEGVDRARAGLYLSRWLPERAGSWPSVLRTLWDRGLMVSDLSGEEEQMALLEASRSAGVTAEAILSALDSRFNTVRERAVTMREKLPLEGWRALNRTLLEHAPRYPQAALRLIDRELAASSSAEPRPLEDGWRLLWAALALIEERPKPSTAEAVLAWLAPQGAFERALQGRDCPEEHRLRLTVLLRQWRSSDRYLFPALELASRVGLGDAVAAVRAAREASTRKLFDQVGQQTAVELPVMTRATWERLKRELERMERELRTEIPKTIQRARELGDLRENAEYHSAKLKQANLSKQVAALQLRLLHARFVDDVEHQEGVAGPGTEVVLEADRERVTYWILGEDEHHHGPQVVSFQAPVGRALTGRTIGDEVLIDGRIHRVVSIARKLPALEQEAASTENTAGD